MSTIEKAIEIAARAHTGQIDKAGAPYIFHPLRVMMAVSTPDQKMAAILHDVVEDTAVTFDDLKTEGFSQEILAAVFALTKTDGEARIDAAKRAAQNPIALVVKLADVTDNMDLSRIANPTEKDFARLKEYASVKELLESVRIENAVATNPKNVYRAYPITEKDRDAILTRFTPRFSRVIADHISAEGLRSMDKVVEGSADGKIVGEANGEDYQALVVSVNGKEKTYEGTYFHISLSVAPDFNTGTVGQKIVNDGFYRIDTPIPLDLSAGASIKAPLKEEFLSDRKDGEMI